MVHVALVVSCGVVGAASLLLGLGVIAVLWRDS